MQNEILTMEDIFLWTALVSFGIFCLLLRFKSLTAAPKGIIPDRDYFEFMQGTLIMELLLGIWMCAFCIYTAHLILNGSAGTWKKIAACLPVVGYSGYLILNVRLLIRHRRICSRDYGLTVIPLCLWMGWKIQDSSLMLLTEIKILLRHPRYYKRSRRQQRKQMLKWSYRRIKERIEKEK